MLDSTELLFNKEKIAFGIFFDVICAFVEVYK